MSTPTSSQPTTESSLHSPKRRKFRIVGIWLSAVWLVLVVGGLSYLLSYENGPGFAASSPQRLPIESRIQGDGVHYTLIMLAHPKCPCTRASIGELASVMAHSQGRVKSFVLFLRPDGFSDSWERTDLWQSAASIPGVEVLTDSDGNEARRFQAATSGQTLLYDASGRLVFSGGITAARGHSGDNAGKSAIVSMVNSETPDQTATPVFGCPLFNPEECQRSEHETNEH